MKGAECERANRHLRHQKSTPSNVSLSCLSFLGYDGEVAEGGGFEPPRRSPVYTLSRRAPSTTRPPLHRCERRVKHGRGGACNLRRRVFQERSIQTGT